MTTETTQAEALRLANLLIAGTFGFPVGHARCDVLTDSATELRRLHVKVEQLQEEHASVESECVAKIINGKVYFFDETVLPDETKLYTTPQPPAQQPLTVTIRSYPESNGKRNWTALLLRTTPWDGLIGNGGGITIAYGERWNRVAYEAERARVLLGERVSEPDILAYCKDVATPDEWTGVDPEAAHIKGDDEVQT